MTAGRRRVLLASPTVRTGAAAITETIVRAAEPRDEERWHALWDGYLRFYRGSVSEEATAGTWAAILDEAGAVDALLAEADGRVVGLCHFLFHATTWDTRPVCYLQDLFVDPQARGTGAARRLIRACEARTRERGASGLYWVTQEYNGPARSLYDTIVPRSSFIVYEMGF